MKEQSNYPYIALEIKNFKPNIVFYPDESISRVMTLNEEDLGDLMIKFASRLDLIEDNITDKISIINELLMLARESDEQFFNAFNEVDNSTVELDLEKTISKYLVESQKAMDDFSDIQDLPPEIKDELLFNQNADLYASIMEAIYNIMIAKVLLAAAEVGIGKIVLDDDLKNSRLQEKMASELSKMGIDLLVQ